MLNILLRQKTAATMGRKARVFMSDIYIHTYIQRLYCVSERASRAEEMNLFHL
jgi:hypothetical protein